MKDLNPTRGAEATSITPFLVIHRAAIFRRRNHSPPAWQINLHYPWTSPTFRPLAVAGLLLPLIGISPKAGTAQDAPCPGPVVQGLFIDNHSIFNAAEIDDEARLAWFYRVAHRIHSRTRASFIERELLFEVGDCMSPLLLSESERILRSYNFIAEADIYPVEIGDGDVHVVVDTEDEWTTKLEARADLDGGLRFTRLGATEENFLGTGNLVGAFLRERDEQRDIGFSASLPRFLASRTNAFFTVGSTRTGTFFEESISYPFVGEVGRYAALESFEDREDLFAYAASAGSGFRNVVLPVQNRNGEITAAARLGEPGSFTVIGAGFSWEEIRFPDFPTGVMVIPGQDFSEQIPADSATVAAVQAQVTARETARVHVLVGRRKIRFVSRRGLDAIRGEQDIRVGTQIIGSLGTTLGRPSTQVAGVSDELWGRISLFAGAAGGDWVLNSDLNLEGARLFTGTTQPGLFRDVLGEFNVYAYWQPSEDGRHTFAGRFSGAGGWSSSIPFQLTLGGRHAVRGYDREDFPAGRRLLVNVEDRIRFDGPLSHILDLGLSVFADAGIAWAGDAPFASNSGVQGSVGFGLRIGFPSGTRNVIRLDLAAPLQAGGLSNLQFRVRMSELVSLLPGFGDRQMLRSRSTSPDAGILGIRRGG